MPKRQVWIDSDSLEGKWSYSTFIVKKKQVNSKLRSGEIKKYTYGYVEVNFKLPEEMIGEELMIAVKDVGEEFMKKRRFKYESLEKL